MQPSDEGEIADQSAVFAFLGDPATYGLSEPIKRIDTHGAVVFLAGDDVYKVKRAVHFSYMDFSTLEKRKAACEAEIAVNRDNTAACSILRRCRSRATRMGFILAARASPSNGRFICAVSMRNATLDRVAETGLSTFRIHRAACQRP